MTNDTFSHKIADPYFTFKNRHTISFWHRQRLFQVRQYFTCNHTTSSKSHCFKGTEPFATSTTLMLAVNSFFFSFDMTVTRSKFIEVELSVMVGHWLADPGKLMQ